MTRHRFHRLASLRILHIKSLITLFHTDNETLIIGGEKNTSLYNTHSHLSLFSGEQTSQFPPFQSLK